MSAHAIIEATLPEVRCLLFPIDDF
jgi:hypothetical protein